MERKGCKWNTDTIKIGKWNLGAMSLGKLENIIEEIKSDVLYFEFMKQKYYRKQKHPEVLGGPREALSSFALRASCITPGGPALCSQ